MVLEGKTSIISFFCGLGVLLIPFLTTVAPHIEWVLEYLTGSNGKIASVVYLTVINGFLLLIYKGPLYKVRDGLLAG